MSIHVSLDSLDLVTPHDRSPLDAHWAADGILADAGVLLHAFDGWEDTFAKWRATGDMSASLIYAANGYPGARIPHFQGQSAGLIFRPGIFRSPHLLLLNSMVSFTLSISQ